LPTAQEDQVDDQVSKAEVAELALEIAADLRAQGKSPQWAPLGPVFEQEAKRLEDQVARARRKGLKLLDRPPSAPEQ
jgi:hypothetical protein